jgi:hypothetical protein
MTKEDYFLVISRTDGDYASCPQIMLQTLVEEEAQTKLKELFKVYPSGIHRIETWTKR